ncbi:hypothetical protein BDV95DRAFT_235189 [Massariosphaeria phaeospora]|uniref:Uncharacterized protein n=1 Tax=Massariosphaeria phaeospora TaxID=100035 RepID=A0A7C8INQ0_9PLEO|nr:hypothetical protein BDV95DRAFT_235189 [Massariosphaeria phaeospora]
MVNLPGGTAVCAPNVPGPNLTASVSDSTSGGFAIEEWLHGMARPVQQMKPGGGPLVTWPSLRQRRNARHCGERGGFCATRCSMTTAEVSRHVGCVFHGPSRDYKSKRWCGVGEAIHVTTQKIVSSPCQLLIASTYEVQLSVKPRAIPSTCG